MSIKKAAAGAVCSVALITGIVVSQYPDQLRTSADGLRLIGDEEGCRRDPYQCPAGALTTGIGSTGRVENRRYTDEEIAQRWVADIAGAENCVNRYFRGKDMPQRAFEAMTSAAFNLGCYRLRWNQRAARPTLIQRAAQHSDWQVMCRRLPEFKYAGGKPMLEQRRIREMQWCLH